MVLKTQGGLIRKATLRVLVLGLCLIPVLALWPPAAGAALFSVDLYAPGDGLVTRDDVSGLDWLDPSESTDISFNGIIAGADGLLAAGWRHGLTAEVCDMIMQIGTLAPETCPFEPVNGDPSELDPYTDLLGFTTDTGFNAYFAVGVPGYHGRAHAGINTSGQASMWLFEFDSPGSVWASPDIGH